MSFHVVIPARFASTRLPGKPLVNLAGKPMIEWVYERAMESGAESVLIATDDQRIVDAAYDFADLVTLTSPAHQSGTDRMAEVVERMGWKDDAILVNVQGDEPMIPPSLIDQVAEGLLHHEEADISTLCTPINDAQDMANTNVVKVVRDQQDFALYFSRAPIPWHRDGGVGNLDLAQRHLGIYGYRVASLKRFASLPAAPIEMSEGLEQLRALAAGMKIHCASTDQAPGHGVDTPEDAAKVSQLLSDKAVKN